MLNRKKVRSIALDCGFKLKEQPNQSMDLNPYVYDFAYSLERWMERTMFVKGAGFGFLLGVVVAQLLNAVF